MKFTISRTSGKPPDIPGAVFVSQEEEAFLPYTPYSAWTRRDTTNHTFYQVFGRPVREAVCDGKPGIVYSKDTSNWTIEIPDLGTLLALPGPVILDGRHIEIYDDYRE